VKDDANDFYGQQYWFKHQTKDLEYPDILARSRSDLAERCVHWLRTLLEFKLPPAKVLEIGCAHGGFVAMLRQAGFDATGLELSPAIVRLATDTFRVPVLTGPIEDQSIEPGTLDAIVMMDVMGCLPQPAATLGKCMQLLKPDGVMLIQTCAYPEGLGLRQLTDQKHKFVELLDGQERPFLFSQTAIRELFNRLGAGDIEFVPAIFGFYDMSFIVTKGSLHRNDPQSQAAALCRTVNGRFIQALLDLDERRLSLLSKYRQLRDQSPVPVS
jgi:SAM-dependent methyltransferase